ncbi:MAG: DUF2970 domain-containing protein [Burkholderiales bacterium]|nr:DUF2970 domain-containing protein [Burkholderiales bacterium]
MDVPEHDRSKRASLLQVAKAVGSGFFGVRRRADHEAVRISPLQLIIVGVIGAALFVTALLLLVQFVLRLAGA